MPTYKKLQKITGMSHCCTTLRIFQKTKRKLPALLLFSNATALHRSSSNTLSFKRRKRLDTRRPSLTTGMMKQCELPVSFCFYFVQFPACDPNDNEIVSDQGCKKFEISRESNQSFPPRVVNFPSVLKKFPINSYFFISQGDFSFQMAKFPNNEVPKFSVMLGAFHLNCQTWES